MIGEDLHEVEVDKDSCVFGIMMIFNFGDAYGDDHNDDGHYNEENEDNHPALHYLPGEEDIGGVVQHNLIS